MHLKTPQPEGVNMHEWMLRQVAPAAIGCRFIKMVHQKQRHLMNIQPKAHHRICSSHQQHVESPIVLNLPRGTFSPPSTPPVPTVVCSVKRCETRIRLTTRLAVAEYIGLGVF